MSEGQEAEGEGTRGQEEKSTVVVYNLYASEKDMGWVQESEEEMEARWWKIGGWKWDIPDVKKKS